MSQKNQADKITKLKNGSEASRFLTESFNKILKLMSDDDKIKMALKLAEDIKSQAHSEKAYPVFLKFEF